MRRETKMQARRRAREAGATNIAHEKAGEVTTNRRARPSIFRRISDRLFGPIDHASPVRVTLGPPIPPAPAPEMPVRNMHEHTTIAQRVLAIVAGIDEWAAKRLGRMRAKLAKETAVVTYRAWRAARTQKAEDEAGGHLRKYEASVPPEHRNKLEPRPGVQRLIPWALILADAAIMQRPWTLWGGAFGASQAETTALSYLRALLIAFAVVWSLRIAGSKLRSAIVELAGQRGQEAAQVGALVIVAISVIGAFLLADAAAQLQGVLFAILSGGTSTAISNGTFRLIVMFLIATSFAAGYFTSSPEADEAERVRRPYRKAVRRNERATKQLERARGAVAATGERIAAFERRVDARKGEQIRVGLEEINRHKAAHHELTGVSSHDDPIAMLQVALDSLETATKTSIANGSGANGKGPTGRSARRRVVEDAVAEVGERNGHA